MSIAFADVYYSSHRFSERSSERKSRILSTNLANGVTLPRRAKKMPTRISSSMKSFSCTVHPATTHRGLAPQATIMLLPIRRAPRARPRTTIIGWVLILPQWPLRRYMGIFLKAIPIFFLLRDPRATLMNHLYTRVVPWTGHSRALYPRSNRLLTLRDSTHPIHSSSLRCNISCR